MLFDKERVAKRILKRKSETKNGWIEERIKRGEGERL